MYLVARRLTLIVAAGAFAGAVPAAAQDWKGMGRMEGKVTDESGAPLAGVTVKLDLPERGGGTSVKTDKSTSSFRATRAGGSA